jgi:two-component system, NarL family, sensor histidine kinase UhpB
LQLLQERGQDIPFIVVSGAIGEEVAVAIVKEGAADYLLKDRLARLAPAVTAALERGRLREEKRIAEETVRRAERKYRELFRSAMEGICQSTPQGQILTANPAMATMLGYSSPEEVTVEVQDIAGKLHVDSERHAELVRLLEQNGSVRGFECQFFRKDRSTIWVSMNNRAARDNDGKIILYSSTVQDITAFKTAEAALRQHQEELRDLAARLISAQETERSRLGRDLHDGFSQKLAMLGIELALLRTKPPASPRIFQERLAIVCEQVKELAKNLHHISRAIHPAVLYDLGLWEALRHECSAFAEQHGIQVKSTIRKLQGRISDDVSLCLYRVTQESLWNIRNHAKARKVSVALTGENGDIVLAIEDDGCGFVRDAVRGKGGLGLVSMEERVRHVGGRLSIAPRTGGGTRVEARVPSP